MNTWGFTNSFGAFQTYLTDTLNSSPSTISWIGSMQIFLLFFMGTISGRLTDSGHFRVVFFVGSLATVVGIFASSFCHQFWQFFLALGVAVGVGNGCLFCPMLTVMSPYFDKRRAMAIGIVACGSASGGLIYSSIARQLVPSVGFPWTMRTISLIQFALLAVANVYLRPRVPAKSSSPWVDWAAFRDMRYSYYAISSFFVSNPDEQLPVCVIARKAFVIFMVRSTPWLTITSPCSVYISLSFISRPILAP